MPNVSVAQIAKVTQQIDKIQKADLDPAVKKKFGDATKQYEARAHKLNEKVTPEADYLKLQADVDKHIKEVAQAQALAVKNRGPVFSWKGKKGATEADAIAHVKKELPSSGHGNISQAMNDVTLGRGKATPKASGVLHASAGSGAKRSGCTIFFKRDGDDIEIVAIGQHEPVENSQKPAYFINWAGSSPFKENAVYQF